VYFLASDYLGGRVPGSDGYRTAAEYAASQFVACGLQPFRPGGDGNKKYLLPVSIPQNESAAGTSTVECCNVAALLPGTSPDLRGEYVLVTAHLDHIPPIGGEVCNGADDNASGCAAVLEIAAKLANEPMERSVLFVLFTAEDYTPSPRFGSRHFLEHWPEGRGSIFVNVNLDMIGREDTTWPKPGAITIMNSETVCPELRAVCAAVNEKTCNLPLHYDVSQGGSSDSKTFYDAGIPALGLFTGAHPDLHRPSDEADKISFPRIQQVAGLGLEITRALASGETDLCR
jgi:Zn-dependent M28 family amino/carboxypeptidase